MSTEKPLPYKVVQRTTEPWDVDQRVWYTVTRFGAGVLSYEFQHQAQAVAKTLNRFHQGELE